MMKVKVLTICCNAPLCLDRHHDYLCSECGLYYGVDGAWCAKGSSYPDVLILLSYVYTHVELTSDGFVVLVRFKCHPPKDSAPWPTTETQVVTKFDEVLTCEENMTRMGVRLT